MFPFTPHTTLRLNFGLGGSLFLKRFLTLRGTEDRGSLSLSDLNSEVVVGITERIRYFRG